MWNHFYKAKEFRYEVVDHNTRDTVCQLPVSPFRDKHEIDANLIAAAPELFFELQEILQFIERSSLKENEESKAITMRAKELVKEVTTSKLRRPLNVRIGINRLHKYGTRDKDDAETRVMDRCFLARSKDKLDSSDCKPRSDWEVYHKEDGINSDEFTDGRAFDEICSDVPRVQL